MVGPPPPIIVVRPDPALYMPTSGEGGGIGTIKAFRDPAYFCDTADMSHYLFFAGSLAGSASPFNGVVGFAHAPADHPEDWTLQPPLIVADGLNNELERPHMIRHAGLYYLFWSTQRRRFAAGVAAPTGLYGMVADGMAGPWRPLNDSGLVAANPPEAPMQAYCWWVTGEGEVTSFVDYRGVAGPDQPTDAGERRAVFGGTPAPWFALDFDGDRVTIRRD